MKIKTTTIILKSTNFSKKKNIIGIYDIANIYINIKSFFFAHIRLQSIIKIYTYNYIVKIQNTLTLALTL